MFILHKFLELNTLALFSKGYRITVWCHSRTQIFDKVRGKVSEDRNVTDHVLSESRVGECSFYLGRTFLALIFVLSIVKVMAILPRSYGSERGMCFQSKGKR